MNPINHLVVLMMENRSFDHVLGSLQLSGRDDVDGISKPYRSNPTENAEIEQSCLDGVSPKYDLPHGRSDVLAQYDDGAMDGFVRSYVATGKSVDPRIPMGFYTKQTLPVLYALADKFTVCDRWFSSMLSSTWPNRKYFHSGTRDQDDDTQTLPSFPGFRTTPIYKALEETPDPTRPGQGLTWKNYFADMPFLAFWYAFAATHNSNFDSILAFAEDCACGALPHVAVVDPPFGLADDHPPHDPALGEKFIGLVVDALTTSKSWHDTALLIVFDEHGGFYDHVVPDVPKIANKWKDTPYGFRVPALLISPYTSGRRCISTVFDHTSFMKSLHERWGVEFPAVEYDVRWTVANSIWAAFDFQADPLGVGIYTGVTRDDSVAALNWASGVYDRLQDDTQRFEQFLDRIFVLPELKALDRRAALFDTLNAFEHHVITQKRMFGAAEAAETGTL